MRSIFLSYSRKKMTEVFFEMLRMKLREFEYEVIDPTQFTSSDADSASPLPQDLIKKSDVVIAFPNESAAQVFFDLGYAIGIGKQVLIVCPSDMNLPRSLRGVNWIKGDTTDLSLSFLVLAHLGKLNIPEVPQSEPEANFRIGLLKYRDDPASFDLIDPAAFEEMVFKWFESKGYEAKMNRDFYGGGYDIVLNKYKGHAKTLVEIKKYNKNNKISVGEVRRLLGAVYGLKADCGILLTTSEFTRSARDFAENVDLDLELWSMDDVLNQF